jgi:hypothetical protein
VCVCVCVRARAFVRAGVWNKTVRVAKMCQRLKHFKVGGGGGGGVEEGNAHGFCGRLASLSQCECS